MSKISKCPKCGSYLQYDPKVKEYYCDSCNYVEYDVFEFRNKFRKELN